MPFIEACGINFFYQQSGAGPDVVLVHGITGNMAIWPLIDLIDGLVQDFRVTYFDLRGHGYSDTPPSGYTSKKMAEDLLNIQNALDLKPSLVVGHSFGAVVAAHAAILDPESIRGLVLSDPFFQTLKELHGDVTKWSGWQGYVERGRRHGISINQDNWVDVGNILSQAATLSDENRKKFVEELGEAALARLVRLDATSCGVDTGKDCGLDRQALRKIHQPTVAMFGIRSPFLPSCKWLVENLENCRIELIPEAEHLAHEENPTVFVEVVQRRLQQMAGFLDGWDDRYQEQLLRDA